MKRKLFFFLEKLQIKRSERIAMVLLFSMLIFTSSFYWFSEPTANYAPEHYAELERVFLERSERFEREKKELLARYKPERSTAPISDSEPILTESKPDTAETDTTRNETAETDLININTASFEELQELPGVGPAYAERIIEWREEHGPFTEKEQLLEIRGIGERRLENMKSMIEL